MDQDTKKMTRTAIYVAAADTFCIWHISYLADCLKARLILYGQYGSHGVVCSRRGRHNDIWHSAVDLTGKEWCQRV